MKSKDIEKKRLMKLTVSLIVFLLYLLQTQITFFCPMISMTWKYHAWEPTLPAPWL
jgi:hypothetical protein